MSCRASSLIVWVSLHSNSVVGSITHGIMQQTGPSQRVKVCIVLYVGTPSRSYTGYRLPYGRNPTQVVDAFYYGKNPAKFHPDPIWNDGVLDFLEEHCPNKHKIENKNKEISSDMGSIPDPKIFGINSTPVSHSKIWQAPVSLSHRG